MKSLKAVAPLRSRLPFTRIGAVVASITCCIALSACGDKKVKPASQVAAKVNGDEITVHQINFVLQQQRGLKPEQVDEASRTVLERLIDQEIAVQMAVKAKLDRDPRVVQAIEAGRRDALARAYIESQAEGTAKPSAEEINKYYGDKPALFKNRRVYTFQEFVIQAPPQAMATVQSTLLSAKTS